MTLNVNQGDFVVIRGQSGCGKSTLFNIIATIDFPDNGDYSFNGVDMYGLKKHDEFRRNEIGIIFQDFNLMEVQTVEENILLKSQYLKSNIDNIQERLEEILQRFDLTKIRNKKCRLLSGGEQQRVAIARAVFYRPKVLLADEPTGNLDKKNANIVFKSLESLNQSGLTIILITHNIDYISEKHTKYYLEDGKLKNDD